MEQINVDLWQPTITSAGNPSKGFEQKLHHALAKSLLGEEIRDVRFALFNRRGDNDVTDPRIIFANSSLLRGHTRVLDDLLKDSTAWVTGIELAGLAYNAYDYELDSDLESTSSTGGEAHTYQKKFKPQTRQLGDDEQAILVPDTAFSTWKALILYLYFGKLHFKPLTRTASCRVETNDCDVACSPKSMYRLALKIGHEELQKLSLEAIIGDLTEDNIVEELFSHFTSMYPEVQKAELGVLILLLKEPNVTQMLTDKIKNVTMQALPHCGAIVAAIVDQLCELAISKLQPLDSGSDSNKLLGNGNDDDDNDDNDSDNDNDDDIGGSVDKKRRCIGLNTDKINKGKDDGKDEKSSSCDLDKPKPGEIKPQTGKGDENESFQVNPSAYH
ncbi:hypothetical protein H2248_011537 [Termitomyces sp. 'cryptogamus']|nr:hypothetical protein H2248_011537 [Termitomyces sp. 'cryptogamus']